MSAAPDYIKQALSLPPGDCPACGRDTCEGHEAGPRFEALPDFLRRVGDEGPRFLIANLLPEGIAFWHGRPRSMKSLAALDAALALATGTPAFDDARFAVPEAVDVLLLTEEDSERTLAFRLRIMAAGRKLVEAPRRLHVVSRAGWCLESRDDQEAMLQAVRAVPGAKVLMIDPARGSLPSIDKGPADAAPGVRFLRRLMRETGIECLLLVHHDTKPLAQGRDERSRAERMSGGVSFSIADAPVAFERLNDRTAFVAPCAFKHGADPKPFRLEFQSGSPAGEGFRDFLRAVASESSEAGEQAARAATSILGQLEQAGGEWLATAELVKGSKREAALAALKLLRETGRVVYRKAGRGLEYASGSNGSERFPEPLATVPPAPSVGGPGTAAFLATQSANGSRDLGTAQGGEL